MDDGSGVDAFCGEEGEGAVAEGEAELRGGEEGEGAGAGSGGSVSVEGGEREGERGGNLSGRCSPVVRMRRTRSRYWCSW